MSHPNLSKMTASARGERGAALTMAMLIMALVAVISIAVLGVVKHEANIAGSDLQQTRTFYAASAGLEKMTHDFSDLFRSTAKPTKNEMCLIAADPPEELVKDEGFTFKQVLKRNDTLLAALKSQNGDKAPRTKIPNGPFADMYASLEPYFLTTLATHGDTKTQVRLEREVNNYMIPLFQFATFSDGDLEFWPEPPMSFIGRVHANGNIYFGGDITFYDRVTTAGEAVRNKLRNGGTNDTKIASSFDSKPRFINPLNKTKVALMTVGSVVNGPNLGTTTGRGAWPGSPTGTINSTWDGTSTQPLNGTNNQFGEFLKTATTGARKLLLPLQVDGRAPIEIIKRNMADDNTIMSQSRYHKKAEVRILIDDENAGDGGTNGSANVAGIEANKGVYLSQWKPSELDNGNALRVVGDNGDYLNTTDWYQGDVANATAKKKAMTVRNVRNDYVGDITASGSNTTTGGAYAKTNCTGTGCITDYTKNVNKSTIPKTSNGTIIPPGSGIKGRILIQIVKPDGTTVDVTQTILSMGVTVGEPNAIVHLQRPLWASFMQGSRDRVSTSSTPTYNYLTYFLNSTVADRRAMGDGEIKTTTGSLLINAAAGFISSSSNNLDDDPHTSTAPFQPTAATMARDDKPDLTGLNQIVPINVYNVREGRITETSTYPNTNIYTRGITTVVELNMRNLARWLDGVYDSKLLAGTQAVSTNIASPDGWIVYVSDRRGDRVKQEKNSAGTVITTTNGFADNEDIYNYPGTNGGAVNPGEDVIDFGYDVAKSVNKKETLQRDVLELPDPAAASAPNVTPPTSSGYTDATRYGRAMAVGKWLPTTQTAGSTNYYFRRAVRLFNGEDLKLSGAAEKLSETKGITVATENMVYIWGNYNTAGIKCQPTDGSSTENDPKKSCYYLGDQVPASIAADAFFPLSKTWFDAVSAMYPEGANNRIADAGTASAAAVIAEADETSVRAGIIAGTTLSAMNGTPAALTPLVWLNGGVHNFPRFLETWSVKDTWEKRWNYTGSFIILYNSTQAVGPWSVTSSEKYYPPKRNWAFDITLTDPNRLPPGTPQFQFVQATGFRETPFNTTVTADPCS